MFQSGLDVRIERGHGEEAQPAPGPVRRRGRGHQGGQSQRGQRDCAHAHGLRLRAGPAVGGPSGRRGRTRRAGGGGAGGGRGRRRRRGRQGEEEEAQQDVQAGEDVRSLSWEMVIRLVFIIKNLKIRHYARTFQVLRVRDLDGGLRENRLAGHRGVSGLRSGRRRGANAA